MEYNKYFDHTNLKPDAKKEDILVLCAEANKYKFMSVCVNPYYVSLAHELLLGSDVLVCTVIGFPLGANTKEVKAFEVTKAIQDGADEVDMVINISEAKAHNWDYVYEDIKAVVDAANGVLVKVIIETCLLTDLEAPILFAPAFIRFKKSSFVLIPPDALTFKLEPFIASFINSISLTVAPPVEKPVDVFT